MTDEEKEILREHYKRMEAEAVAEKRCSVRQWKLAVILPCRYGPRKRSMTELLFCMLRSGH